MCKRTDQPYHCNQHKSNNKKAKEFTYKVPVDMQKDIKIGSRVKVSFGKMLDSTEITPCPPKAITGTI